MKRNGGNFEITAYSDRYEAETKSLLVELQEYLAAIDPFRIQTLSPGFRDDYFKWEKREIEAKDGGFLLARYGAKIAGLAAYGVEAPDEEDRMSTICPKRGKIFELIVSAQFRGQGIGKALLQAAERELRARQCDFIAVDVFAPNENAKAFYREFGYELRNAEFMKRGLPPTRK